MQVVDLTATLNFPKDRFLYEEDEILGVALMGDPELWNAMVEKEKILANAETGFDAERIVFLRTMVWNANNRLVFQSGDLDPNGDLRDNHSLYVHNGQLPLDRQLFSLQSRFITRNIRGGEREQVVNVPYSLDPLPYIRPATRPFNVLGRPIAARKHKQNIEVNGCRTATYKLDCRQLIGPGPFTVRVQLIAGMVPVNLIHVITPGGFDYGMSAKDVADGVVEGHQILYEEVETIDVD